MTSEFRLSETLRESLESALIEEHDLLRALRGQPPQELPDQPGRYCSRCTLAVRRPLDPETMQMIEVVVLMRPAGDGWELYAVEGLDRGKDG